VDAHRRVQPAPPVLPTTPADPEILEIARPYHEAAERYLEQPVAESPADLSGAAVASRTRPSSTPSKRCSCTTRGPT